MHHAIGAFDVGIMKFIAGNSGFICAACVLIYIGA